MSPGVVTWNCLRGWCAPYSAQQGAIEIHKYAIWMKHVLIKQTHWNLWNLLAIDNLDYKLKTFVEQLHCVAVSVFKKRIC